MGRSIIRKVAPTSALVSEEESIDVRSLRQGVRQQGYQDPIVRSSNPAHFPTAHQS